MPMRSASMPLAPSYEIILKPLSNPELGDIGIDETLFAVGRTEPPFDGYPSAVVTDLSRRHARIFCENGVVHVADMGSKNGTTVNGTDVRQKTARLQNGDEIRFGRTLAYRVELAQRPPVSPARLVSLTLQPTQEQLDLQPIVVVEFPFLIGKADAAFARYKEANPHQVNYLSRRHAHVFLRRGMPYVEDLGSTNGTFVNGKRLDEHAVALQPDDTLAFGGHHFVYKVSLQTEDLQADPTLTRFATVMSGPAGAADTLAGSAAGAASAPAPVPANGSKGNKADTHGVLPPALQPSRQPGPQPGLRPGPQPGRQNPDRPGAASAMTAAATATAAAADAARDNTLDPEKTTFIAAANSFLDIFCIDQAALEIPAAPPASVSGPEQTAQAGTRGDANRAGRRRPRNRWAIMAAEIAGLLAGPQRQRLMRRLRWGIAALCGAVAIGMMVYTGGSDVRRIKELVGQGDNARAAKLANAYLRDHPDNAEIRAFAAEAILKAEVPPWLDLLAQRQFDRAQERLAALQNAARTNPDLAPLLRELDWIGGLERFFATHAGTDAPIRIYADEDRMAALLKQWDDDRLGHQRALGTIAGHVPRFRETYAEALSHLRKLQSDNAVYLAAIERLKTGIDTELQRERVAAIEPLLKSTTEKYPRLVGLEPLRADLQRYTALDEALRHGRLGPIVGQLNQLGQNGFVTPPFQSRLRGLTAAGRLPPADLQRRYAAVQDAWLAGDVAKAFGALQAMPAGAWAPAVAAESSRKQQLAAQFTALEKSRSGSAREDRLLALYENLDPQEDGFFLKALEADTGFDRNGAVKRAQQQLQQAAGLWQRYRHAGTIDDADRQDTSISDQFRTQSALLAQSLQAARQARQLYRILRLEPADPPEQLADEVAAEAGQQRSALLAARASLPPAVLQAKLALLDAAGKGRTP